MSAATWKKVTVPVTAAMEDAVSDFLTTLTGRGVCSLERNGTVLVEVYLDPGSDGEQLRSIERFIEDLTVHGDLPGDTGIEVREVPEEDWMAVFRSQHGPVRISPRLVVRPAWWDPVGPDDIIIDPGLAFGTGSHATTRMSLVLLDEAIGSQPPSNMLDLGTGSGVLAIAGAKLGIKDVLAVDIDPIAVETAAENVLANTVRDRVRIVEGGLEKAEVTFDIVTANLSGSLLVDLASGIARCVAPSGTLIISGITTVEKERVLEAFSSRGFEVVKIMEEDDWVGIRMVKR